MIADAKIAAEARIAEEAKIAADAQAKIAAEARIAEDAKIAVKAQFTKAIVFSTKEARAYAANTLRKTWPDDVIKWFEWPTKEDILSWPLDKPTTVSRIDYWTDGC
jgi:hypothetical protein